MTKRSRRGFTHALTNEAHQAAITEEEALAIYQNNLHENPEQIHQLVLGHLRLGMTIVAGYAKSYPNKIDELVSEMAYALVWGCYLISNGSLERGRKIDSGPNIPGYLVSSITGRLNRFLKKAKYTSFRELQDIPVILPDFTQIDELWQIVLSCVETDRERAILNLRCSGMTDREIARKLVPPITPARVGQIRNILGRRIKEKLQNGDQFTEHFTEGSGND